MIAAPWGDCTDGFNVRPATLATTIPAKRKPASADDGGMTTDSSNLVLRERTGSIHWLIELQPGETKTLAYEYERYVPSN